MDAKLWIFKMHQLRLWLGVIWIVCVSSIFSAELNSVDTDYCPMMSQLQSSVIRIMGTHYEYGKGIHSLHSMVTNLQQDMVDLKSEIGYLRDSQVTYDKSANVEKDKVIAILDFMSGFVSPDPDSMASVAPYTQWAPDFLSFVRNVTKSIHTQSSLYSKLRRSVTRIRKQLTKVTNLWSKVQQTTHFQQELSPLKPQQKESQVHVPTKQENASKDLVKKMNDRVATLEKQINFLVNKEDDPYAEQDLQGLLIFFAVSTQSKHFFYLFLPFD